ncbi:TetR/AcrR family transcriptional regulator [Herbiconiux sp. KACC 21604]|uniref:TetR/AcrR family transcriptional regulator n=1 Tax=unclassified Herbiconiux TaxID=2618217 RepID=UPI0014908B2D|nr:TetR/AcrR family transcriptional regulator [Herbiconiux sp. SALV-R1]QJU52358.1 TetR/AcrR family transcriptional regulator [Herbiconiux sp. SALV-R1]WPO87214.1 TetR/AcrR family transcriptional regulator [Herbiconiux sp. KACC 21604]
MSTEPSDAPPRRRARGRASKREAILAASVELFNTQGYEMTSMDAVAARAGVSKTTVYAHFGDKLALYREMADRAVTLLDVDFDRLHVDESLSTFDKLVSLARLLVESLTSETFLAFHRVMILEANNRSDLTTRLVPGAPHVVDVVADILREDAVRLGYEVRDVRAHAALFARIAVASFEIDALLDKDFHPDDELVTRHAAWVAHMLLLSIRPSSVVAAGGEELGAPPPAPDYLWLPERIHPR